MDSTEQKIGDYLLTEPLGDDEVGRLYLGRHAETGEPCVVNILHEEYAEDKRLGERFRSVARTLGDLTHGRIVAVREMRRTDGRYFVAMEYVAGPRGKPMSLKDYLAYRSEQADGTVQDKLVRIWSIQIGEALAFAHNHGQSHHALTPEKVLIDAANNVTTGISAADRAQTIGVLADPASKPADLARPGHIFPIAARRGGVLQAPYRGPDCGQGARRSLPRRRRSARRRRRRAFWLWRGKSCG